MQTQTVTANPDGDASAIEYPSCRLTDRHQFDKRAWRAVMGEPSTCYLCAKPIEQPEATLDHVIPTSRGGRNHTSNVRWACRRCNQMKADLTLDELYEAALTILANRANSYRAADTQVFAA